MVKTKYNVKDKTQPTNGEFDLTRKSFVRMLMLSGLAVQLPWLNSCSSNSTHEVTTDTKPFTKKQFQLIQAVQTVLFPDDGNGPSALEVNADKYLLWVMQDPLLDAEERAFMLKRIDKFEKFCSEKYKTGFVDLNNAYKRIAIEEAMQYEWGKKWISRMITLILEALLLDPIYGVNTAKKGWEWLQHNPGMPRPKNETKYPEILKKHAV